MTNVEQGRRCAFSDDASVGEETQILTLLILGEERVGWVGMLILGRGYAKGKAGTRGDTKRSKFWATQAPR